MSAFTNIAAYKFARLDDLKPLRERLLVLCRDWDLKGTILLSTEGINLFVAGRPVEVDSLLATLRAIPGLEGLTPKFSDSDEQPFTRMLVRIKKEIIAFGVEGIDPAARTSPKLSAHELRQWLDEGREIVLLDTRNDYEVKLGTFKGAHILGIDHFRQFPDAVDKLPETMKQAPIVMFCTGGIRCEKAGPFMERQGFQSVFQLDGGILKYFEECGGAHYDGECFVFDQRVGVDPALRETDSTQCFVCQSPLSAEDQEDSRYVAGKSCPYCFQAGQESYRRQIESREAAIRQAATPLPGSIPATNRRPFGVPGRYDGYPLLDVLSEVFEHIPREDWRALCESGGFTDENDKPVSPSRIVRAGERYYRHTAASIEPNVNVDIRILHEDEAILVLSKPAPLPMHPSGRFERNTLQHILNTAYTPQKPRGVHRLDAATSGVVLFARTRHFAKILQPQFEHRTVEKLYLAKVSGHPTEDMFICEEPISAEPGASGAREIDPDLGQPARTEFRVLERREDGTTLLEARPLTGRTNQIRVHLWQMGFPICGDPMYLADCKLGETATPALEDPPLCLHAFRLAFDHPRTKERVVFEAPLPDYFGIRAGA